MIHQSLMKTMLKKMKMRGNYNKENRMKKISYSILKELIDNIKDDEEIVIDENGIKKVKRVNEQY